MNKMLGLATITLLLSATFAIADELVIPMNMVDSNGVGKSVGSVTASESPYGVIFTPNLSDLTAGLHGFHVHENADCSAKEKDGKMVGGLGAGGHFDPEKTGKHEGPYGKGHLGDLPALYVTDNGKANYPVLAPRLKLSDLKGRSLMIHAGGDNHADHPEKLGGGGSRMVCGVVK